MPIDRLVVTVFLVLHLVACSADSNKADCTAVDVEFTSAPLRIGKLHEFRIEITVASCEEQLRAFPDAGRPLIQAALDETVGSLRTLSELYAEDLSDKVRTAINRDAAEILAKEVRVNQVTHAEYELRSDSGSD